MAFTPILNPQPVIGGQQTASSSTVMQNAAVATGVGTNLVVTGYGTALVSITGTFVATITFEVSSNAGGNWDPISATKMGTSVISPTTTTPGQYRLSVTSLDLLRANVVWTSGTSITAIGRATNAVNASKVVILAPSTNTIGAVTGLGAAPLALDATLTSGAAKSQSTQVASTIPAATTMQNAAVAAGNGVNLNVQGYASAIISITGTMSAGTTITFKESTDDGVFNPIAAHQLGVAGNLSTTTTVIGDYRISCANLKSLQAVISTYGAGTITAKGYASPIAGHGTTVNANIIAPLPAGTAAIGSVVAAGNVAAAATDSGNPLKIGAVYNSTQPTYTTGQRGDAQIGARGSIAVTLFNQDGVQTASFEADSGDNVATSGSANNLKVKTRPTLFNGTSWDRQYGNWNTTTGDTGAKTATFNGATQTNFNARGASILINMGAVTGTTPTLTAKVQGSADNGTTFFDIPGAITPSIIATGVTLLTVYPGTTVTANAAVSYPLPRTWRLAYTIGGTTPSFTITNVQVGYIL